MCYTTFSVGLKDMETIQQMTYDKDKIKSAIEDAVYTWLTTLEHEPNKCLDYIVSDSGPVWNRDDNDVFKLCEMLFAKIDEANPKDPKNLSDEAFKKMFEAAEAVGSVQNDEIYDLAQNVNMTKITPSEHWNGFNFMFSNGWSISIQQSENHYCKVGESAEVAIFDDEENWYVYDEEKRDIFKSEEDTYVNCYLSADDIAKIISIISQEKVDIRTSE